eukprot:jgi/Picre1/29493/NNA_004879.t1
MNALQTRTKRGSACYLEGIELCKEGGKEGLTNLLAVLNSNASAASSRLKKTDNAIQYAEEAHRILPNGPSLCSNSLVTGRVIDGWHVCQGDALADWNFSNTAVAIQSRRTSFRCVKEAYDAAKDGDKIVLLKGTHNGLGETVSIKKRILIEGEGYLGETVIDQRANVPTFKIERGGVVIRNIDLDQTGFEKLFSSMEMSMSIR